MATVATTTQQQHPWRAAARSAVGVLVALPTALLALAGVLTLVAQDTFAQYLPAGWAAWLLAAAVFVAALAGLLSRVMAYPAVDQFLERFRIGSAPGLKSGYPVAKYDSGDEVLLTDGTRVTLGSIIMNRSAEVASYEVYFASGSPGLVDESRIERLVRRAS